jgi:hypothetical protein
MEQPNPYQSPSTETTSVPIKPTPTRWGFIPATLLKMFGVAVFMGALGNLLILTVAYLAGNAKPHALILLGLNIPLWIAGLLWLLGGRWWDQGRRAPALRAAVLGGILLAGCIAGIVVVMSWR